jgi:hypothetical protein
MVVANHLLLNELGIRDMCVITVVMIKFFRHISPYWIMLPILAFSVILDE